MTAKRPVRGLYVILDQGSLGRRDPVALARHLIRAGAGALQYRAKHVPDAGLLKTCRRLAMLCRKAGVPFIVNDRPDIALASGADGVHLGWEDMPPAVARKILGPDKILGLSSHSLAQARQRAAEKPDYLAIGPVFRSGSKITSRRLLGLSTVRAVSRRAGCPVVAIGGIGPGQAAALMQAGASAVAVIEAVIGKKNPVAAAKDFLRKIDKGFGRRK